MRAAPGNLPILVVDASAAEGYLLAAALKQFGFEVNTAVGSMAARAALRESHYGSIVLAADLWHREDRAELLALRRRAPRTWIIVIARQLFPHAGRMAFRWGADSTLEPPWTMEELAERLSAFSHRSRPP